MTRLMPLSLLLALCACAPERSGGHDDDTPRPGNDYTTALFTIVTNGDGAVAEEGVLVLVDQELACEDLDSAGGLRVWELTEDVPWLTARLHHGSSHDGWLMDYESEAAWRENGGIYNDEVAHFTGEIGVGWIGDLPPDDGTDPEDEPPAPRDAEAPTELGVGSEGATDLFRAAVGDSTSLGGWVESHAGDYAFEATKCPDVFGPGPDGEPVDGGGEG